MKKREPSTPQRLKSTAVLLGLALAGAALAESSPVAAGTGHSWAKDRFIPPPCSGDACKADDPRSGADCQGLLCTFSSAKAMQPPMTAARAEELAKARTEAEAAQAAKPVESPGPSKPRKRLAKAKAAPAKTVASAAPAAETAAAK